MTKRHRRKFPTKNKTHDDIPSDSQSRVVVDHYSDGKVLSKRWFRDNAVVDGVVCNDVLHRSGGPAWVTWYDDGSLAFESWFVNGKHIKYTHYNKKSQGSYSLYNMNGKILTERKN